MERLPNTRAAEIRYGKDQYDKMLDQFMESGHRLVEMTVEDRRARARRNLIWRRPL